MEILRVIQNQVNYPKTHKIQIYVSIIFNFRFVLLRKIFNHFFINFNLLVLII